ncbi:MAG: hypothetical protein LBB72_09200 [Spirochaetaceae bacterium]|jgi:hypothetical protein|nr:hypothetical protein [Spirochaetaceae bacterium]
MKNIALLMLLSLFTQALIAEEQMELSNGVTSSGELLLQLSSLPEVKLGYTGRFSFPFLQGEGPLTKDNNIGLALTAEISPISFNGIAEAVWTPIAFFQLAAGGRIGSGWNLELFGSEIYGIGLNRPNAEGKAENNGQALDGLLWKVQTGGALQFDLAALYPGEWNHVVARSYHEINYKGYTRAAAGESWYFENDDGENCNGFNYYGNFLAGYQMPIFLNMVAFLTEMDLYLYDTPNRDKWGDDKIRWTFSGVFNFVITKQINLTLIAQCRTRKNYQESNWQDLYYRNRTIDNSSPLHLEFYRIAAAFTYTWNL